jgi:curved DNA-binding protein CbpA
MTFYEELGVPPDAEPDAIREAYRNVARLLHPDAQTNPVLKQAAEAQMKRINHVYGILSEPDRRHRYDLELTEIPHRSGAIIIQAPVDRVEFQPRKSGTYVWLAAATICAIFIIWLAAKEPSAQPVNPQPAGTQNADAGASVAASPSTAKRTPGSRQHDDEITRLRAELAAAYADRDRLTRQVASLQTGSRFQPPTSDSRPAAQVPLPATPTPVALPAVALTPELPLPAVSLGTPPALAPVPQPQATSLPAAPNEAPKATRVSGSWAYTHSAKENNNKAIYPPDFIEAVITEFHGHVRGQYRARFKVADASIPPDVNFRFEGNMSGTNGRFPWTGATGAKGEVQIRLISDSTLEVTWAASALGKSMGLASGTAVLTRKN